jgi:hypothetical protein
MTRTLPPMRSPFRHPPTQCRSHTTQRGKADQGRTPACLDLKISSFPPRAGIADRLDCLPRRRPAVRIPGKFVTCVERMIKCSELRAVLPATQSSGRMMGRRAAGPSSRVDWRTHRTPPSWTWTWDGTRLAHPRCPPRMMADMMRHTSSIAIIVIDNTYYKHGDTRHVRGDRRAAQPLPIPRRR